MGEPPLEGWYDAPGQPGWLRWWSGESWTDHYHPVPRPPDFWSVPQPALRRTSSPRGPNHSLRLAGMAVIGLLFTTAAMLSLNVDRAGRDESVVTGEVITVDRNVGRAVTTPRCRYVVQYVVNGRVWRAVSSRSSICPAVGEAADVAYPVVDPGGGRVLQPMGWVRWVLLGTGIVVLVGVLVDIARPRPRYSATEPDPARAW